MNTLWNLYQFSVATVPWQYCMWLCFLFLFLFVFCRWPFGYMTRSHIFERLPFVPPYVIKHMDVQTINLKGGMIQKVNLAFFFFFFFFWGGLSGTWPGHIFLMTSSRTSSLFFPFIVGGLRVHDQVTFSFFLLFFFGMECSPHNLRLFKDSQVLQVQLYWCMHPLAWLGFLHLDYCASTLAMEPNSAASTCRSIPLNVSSVRSTQGFPPNNISTAMSRKLLFFSVLWKTRLLILSDSTFTFNITFSMSTFIRKSTWNTRRQNDAWTLTCQIAHTASPQTNIVSRQCAGRILKGLNMQYSGSIDGLNILILHFFFGIKAPFRNLSIYYSY